MTSSKMVSAVAALRERGENPLRALDAQLALARWFEGGAQIGYYGRLVDQVDTIRPTREHADMESAGAELDEVGTLIDGLAESEVPNDIARLAEYLMGRMHKAGDLIADAGARAKAKNEIAQALLGQVDQVKTQAPWMRLAMQTAETVYVAADKCALVQAAANSMPPDVFHSTDLFAPRGFVWFAHPINVPELLPDEWGVVASIPRHIRAMSWIQHPRILEAGDRRYIDVADALRYAVDGASDADHGIIFWLWEDADEAWRHAGRGQVSPMDTSAWRFGSTTDDAPADLAKWYRRFILAFQRLLWQRIAVVDRERPPREYRRRCERAGVAPDNGTITIVHLRRPVPKTRPEGESTPVNWSHQWIVHGFWRNQWYPSLVDHRRIWIEDFVKGPADRPLVVKDVVWSLDR